MYWALLTARGNWSLGVWKLDSDYTWWREFKDLFLGNRRCKFWKGCIGANVFFKQCSCNECLCTSFSGVLPLSKSSWAWTSCSKYISGHLPVKFSIWEWVYTVDNVASRSLLRLAAWRRDSRSLWRRPVSVLRRGTSSFVPSIPFLMWLWVLIEDLCIL